MAFFRLKSYGAPFGHHFLLLVFTTLYLTIITNISVAGDNAHAGHDMQQQSHGDHKKSSDHSNHANTASHPQQGGQSESAHQGHKMPMGGPQGGAGHHMHDSWVKPPASYAHYKGRQWDNQTSVARGKDIFRVQCQRCHGEDGKGTGPLAAKLEHAPADLTNHFHNKVDHADAYMYWRVSEGGTAEPFKSMKSAMPAFKTILEPGERWDVLTFVHSKFHLVKQSSVVATSTNAVKVDLVLVKDTQVSVVSTQNCVIRDSKGRPLRSNISLVVKCAAE